ncbi:amidohydrolase family protein [Candidatus Aminicenantes bacterium AC-335-A11]|jgi:predicted TIM-barrel fold metal-dependent hydrolase|nr:amidohydrolase family protein [SCandidatus Aminicenantes bacterium Aminicenantia_JdfR_composite]MCP2597782.1 amidohydrolase family protein [Candidatus Aminicenantes bacterium AC-335-L06]MCP2605873.1 amidohydrolase family protein [Candidatus Aminicenantes bacterium AC-335-O07]MCP2618463.1 amidohydrolase family protein [Candidatus Aminicenantes bacterium AC-335-A11]MCP2620507.1 amidohydrolase family protein [Candidatus Aminicenantes bacterium AC-334-E05]
MNSEIIDIHIHFGSPPDEQSGCFWSEEFTKTPAYYAMLLLTKSLFKRISIEQVKKHIIGVINGAKYVDKCVLLAMDMVYDENSTPHPELTHLFVPNSYIVELAKNNKKILLGASIHPYRNDWEEELNFCLENKAVLCKWIPSSQMIDPSHPKCIPFYEKLAEHNLPLLCHAGPEYAIPTSDKNYNEFNNPKYLRTPLELGVTVIIAHCSLPYFWFFDADYQDDFKEFLKLFKEAEEKEWKLFADLSAICTPLRTPYIEKIIENIPSDRLLFGSDYPIPLSELSYNKSTNFFSWLKFISKVFLMKNPLDKNYMLIKGMGFNEKIFTNAYYLFKNIKYKEK